MEPTPKTPKRIKLLANLAILTMCLLIGLALKYMFFMQPQIIETTRTLVLPNDSLVTLREQVAALSAENRVIHATADSRFKTIIGLAAPMQAVTDSLISLQHASVRQSAEIIQQNADDRADRKARHNVVMADIERLKKDQPNIHVIWAERDSALACLLNRTPDTVYVRKTGNFWYRLKHLIRP